MGTVPLTIALFKDQLYILFIFFLYIHRATIKFNL